MVNLGTMNREVILFLWQNKYEVSSTYCVLYDCIFYSGTVLQYGSEV